jgi:hypothetical protein
VREGQGRLGHADGEGRVALSGVGRDLGLGSLGDVDAVGTVHFLCDGLDLLLDRELGVVYTLSKALWQKRPGQQGSSKYRGRRKARRRRKGEERTKVVEVVVLLASLDDGVGEVDGSLTTLGPVVGGDGLVGTGVEGVLLDELELGLSVVAVKSKIRKRVQSQYLMEEGKDTRNTKRAGKKKREENTNVNWLMATTTLMPYFLAFSMCLPKLTHPFSSVSRSSLR